MELRLLALVVALGLGLSLWTASRVYRAWLARTAGPDELLGPLGLAGDKRPLVLGFGGDYCLPCKTVQHPALERLRLQLGDALAVEEVDALEHADLAKRFGVLMVPTTVVLDRARNVVAINYGATSTEKLASQVAPLLEKA